MSTVKKINNGTYRSGPLPLIAKAMGRKYNVTIDIRDGNNPCTDGKIIFLPGLSIDGTPEEVCKLNGFLDHEVGHIKFSDFSLLKGLTPLEKFLSNVLEDPRIERLMEKRYPGAKINLDAMYTLLQTEDAKKKNPKPSQETPAAILCIGLLNKLMLGINRAGMEEQPWNRVVQTFGPILSDKILEIGEAVVQSDSPSASVTGAKAIIALLQLPNPQDVEIEIEIDGFNPHDADEGDEGQSPGGSMGPSLKIKVKSKSNQPSDGGEGEDEGEDSDGEGEGEGQGKPGDKGGSQKGSKPGETGQDQDENGAEAGESESGEAKGNQKGSKGDTPGGSKAALKGTHTGREAADSVLRINDAELDQIGKQNDTGTRAAEGLSANGRTSLTDAHIQVTPWTGSPKSVQILDVDRIAKPLQYRLEDLIQNRLRNDYYTRPTGVRMLKRRTGLYETGMRNIFKQSEEQEIMDTAIYVTFDISGSMSGKNLETAKIATIGIGDALNGFEGLTYQVSSFDTQVFTYDENWVKGRQQIAGTPANGGTAYGPAFMHGVDWLQATDKERKLFVLVTDGEPGDPADANAVAEYARECGIEVFGLSIVGQVSRSMRDIFGKNVDSIQDVRKLPAVLGDLIENNM